MKIKLTIEKVFDSNEFYEGLDPEELDEITFEEFKYGIIDTLYDYPGDILDHANFEIIK